MDHQKQTLTPVVGQNPRRDLEKKREALLNHFHSSFLVPFLQNSQIENNTVGCKLFK